MRFPYLSKLDLDLLYYLAVLLEERHITNAARRCHLSQPAMIRNLDRLREALGDELLIRDGSSHDLTPRGERLLRELQPLLPRIEEILQGREFDPRTSQDRFTVAMTDNACLVLLPQLISRVSKIARSVHVEVVPWTEGCLGDLSSGRIDAFISVAGLGVPPNVASETLFTDSFVCVLSKRHAFDGKYFTMQQYLKYRHIVVAVWRGQQTLVDRPLGDLSLKRKVGLTLPFFGPAISIVAATDMILTLPKRLALKMASDQEVKILDAPAEFKEYRYDMMWHPRSNDDPAHRWFREQVRAVGREMTADEVSR